jgi:RimJ/RimL family protein N-acetyltransferase
MAASYFCLGSGFFSGRSIELRAVQPEDIESIRRWRNQQMRILRQDKLITAREQRAYFEKHVWPDFVSSNPSQVLFAVIRDKVLIGYGGLVHISWKHGRAEISFLLETGLEHNVKVGQGVFHEFLAIVRSIAFEDLKLEKLTTETFEARTHFVPTLEAFGFVLEGVLKKHWVSEGQRQDVFLHALFPDGTMAL